MDLVGHRFRLTGSPTFVHKGLLRLVANVDFAIHQVLRNPNQKGDMSLSVEVIPFLLDSQLGFEDIGIHQLTSSFPSQPSSSFIYSFCFFTFIFVLPFFSGLTNLREKNKVLEVMTFLMIHSVNKQECNKVKAYPAYPV